MYKLENENIVSILGEQMRETCGNMGTKANFGREQRSKDPSGRPAIVLLMWHARNNNNNNNNKIDIYIAHFPCVQMRFTIFHNI